jgi:hypothetical protein
MQKSMMGTDFTKEKSVKSISNICDLLDRSSNGFTEALTFGNWR